MGERLGGVHKPTGPRAAGNAIELSHAFAETFDGRSAPVTTGMADLLVRPARTFETFARTAHDAGLLATLAGVP